MYMKYDKFHRKQWLTRPEKYNEYRNITFSNYGGKGMQVHRGRKSTTTKNALKTIQQINIREK